MKALKKSTTVMALSITVAIIFSLSGCATKKAAWGSMKKGIIMSYGFHPDKNLNYQNTYDFTQEFEVEGQDIIVTAEGDQLLKMMPLVGTSNDLDFLVSIEDMSSTVNTPKGEMVADLEEVIGKSFNLTISKMGKELEYSGAEAISYNYGFGDMKSLSSDIQAFFPDLPGKPILVGDAWESKEIITEKTNSGEMIMDMSNLNTFAGYETMNGLECMKMDLVFSGTIKGSAEEQEMTMSTTGTVKGKGTWYFAYKEGIFVKQELNGEGNTVTEITGPQEMTLPAKRTYTMISVLVD